VLELAGIVLLVVLVLVGALMPLKYTARMQLPKRPRNEADASPPQAPRAPDPPDDDRH
jgi:hypothetical protein